MKTRRLGSSNIEITEIGLGTNYVGGHNFYDTVDESAGIQVVERALELGINFFDTADIYGFGRSEELVGKALGNRKNKVFIATKGGITFEGTQRIGISNRPAYLRRALEASLKRLGRDYVDLYYIHKPDGQTPADEAFGALIKFKAEGLIRAAGVSNFMLPDLKAALSAGPVDALQSRYNIFQREAAAEIMPFCRANRISFIPWGPLAFGLLGGRYTPELKLPENDWRLRTGLFDKKVFADNLRVVERLSGMAEKRGATVAQLAIRWLLSHGEIGSVIAGAKHPAQVEQNVQAGGWKLSVDEIAQIDLLARPET